MKVIRLNHIKILKNKKQRGIILVLTAISIFALIGIVALATEAGHMVLNKTRIQNIADSAALEGAKVLFETSDKQSAEAAARRRIVELMNQLDIKGGSLTPQVVVLSSINPRVKATTNQNSKYVEVTMASDLPKFLGSIFGDEWQKNVDADAVAGRAPVKPTGNTCPTDENTSLIMCTNQAQQSGDNTYFGYALDAVVRIHTGDPSKCGEDTGNIYALPVAGCPAIGKTVKSVVGDNSAEVAATINALFGLTVRDVKPPTPSITPDKVKVDSRIPEFGHAKYTRYNFANNPQGYNYDKYLADLAICNQNPNGASCNSQGVSRARIIRVPVADCNGAGDHSKPTQGTVKGYACMFIPQSIGNDGMDGQVFGQFIEQGACDSLLAGGIDTNPNSASPGKFFLFR
ncbi:MAG: pilus assembly protein TadG-related protein [Pseudomonadota bacterium]